MVIHQAVGPDLHAGALALFPQDGLIDKVVILSEEYRLAAVSALNDMMGNIGDDNSSDSWHE
jgi:hypothetical protein